MYRILLLSNIFLFFALAANSQIGAGHMAKMNAYLQQYGEDGVKPITYEANYGFVHHTVVGYTDHYTISNIKKITVRKVEGGYTVELSCDSSSPCVNHIAPSSKGIYLSGVTYSFSQEKPANTFAKLAAEIIRTDFKKEVQVSYTAFENLPKQVSENKTVLLKKETPTKENKTAIKKPKGSHLNVDAYGDNGEQDFKKILSSFGSQLIQIYELARKGELAKIKGEEVSGVAQSRIKLPKAKRNYINQYKGEDCFIAEFGTKKYYEDLQDMYDEIRDEVEEALPEEYEPLNMAFEKVYENSDDEVFHTEYYHNQNPKMPSIVIRIAPDGKRNTLFLRIGKR